MGHGPGPSGGSMGSMGSLGSMGGMGGGGFKGGVGGGGPVGNGGKSLNNPDFVVVYTFLAEVFDPEVRGHEQKLKTMSPIDRETALLLMRNLSSNLMCQRMWEDQLQLIGAGCPTFVNPSFDDRGLLGGAAGGQVLQASRVGGGGKGKYQYDIDGFGGGGGGDHSNGSSESSRGGEETGAVNGATGDAARAQEKRMSLFPPPQPQAWGDLYMTQDVGDATDGRGVGGADGKSFFGGRGGGTLREGGIYEMGDVNDNHRNIFEVN